ncbi:MAG TPA: hypothetical protein VNU00_09285, partial [Candidatus Binataceae bacterium]|nr:hypothetical protein [Candidatus Binataceae bacterium]
LTSLALLTRKAAALAMVATIVHDPPMLLMLGLLTLAAGLAIVLTHNLWSGGALPVVVTLFGWLILFRGLFLLFLPAQAVAWLIDRFHFGQFFPFYVMIPLAIGAYLTYAGFRRSQS